MSAGGSAIEDILPLSPLQQGLVFHAALADDAAGTGTTGTTGTGTGTGTTVGAAAGPGAGTSTGTGTDAYVAQLVVDLDGPLDPARLRRAANALAARHSALRSGFVMDVGKPVQIVLRTVEVPWTQIDLTGSDLTGSDLTGSDLTGSDAIGSDAIGSDRAGADLTGADLAEAERRADGLVAADRRRSFDLRRPPLLRAMLLVFGPDRHRFVLTNHHVIMDGWSTPLLMRDLFALYAADSVAPGAALPAVRPYRDHLAWLAARDTAASLDAWRAALDGVTAATHLVPAAQGEPTVLPDELVEMLPAELVAGLTGLARSLGVTLNTLVQLAWGILAGRLTGTDDVVFGATVSGRPADLPGVEAMVGLFINTVPVRVRLRPAEAVSELAVRLQREQVDLLDHQHCGLADIQQAVGFGTGELFDSLVVFESFPFDGAAIDGALAAGGLRAAGVHRPISTHYPVTLMVMPSGGGLEVTLKYRPREVGADGARLLLARLRRVLESIVANPGAAVAAVGVLADDESAAILRRAFGDGPLDLADATLHELFEAVVDHTPHAVAVEWDTHTLTYAELDARANALAHRLIALGAGPERLVAVLLPRGADLIVAALAALKAGAGYLPIDPSYPADRIAFTLRDARP
ncbi:condensation domain-containing protein, partial [Frankia sp. AiPs1]|uniref:condensation domain-containing protein n=1 Tax=Frankia sp. AiPs1 TaxID=573493 RepID=UPI00204414E1